MPNMAGEAARKADGAGKPAQQQVEQNVDEVTAKPAFRRFARVGIGSRAFVYLVLAYICARITTMHHSPSQASGAGALAEVARQPGGRPLLYLLGIGLLAYAAWKASQALGDQDEKSVLKRLGRALVTLIYLGLCVKAFELAVSAKTPDQAAGGASGHPQPLVATVLSWPGGPGWVGLGGAVILAVGVGTLIWAAVHDYRKSFPHMHGARANWTRALGGFGDGTRGLLACLLCVYVFKAAVDNNPSKAKSLAQALVTFGSSSPGEAILWVATAGLVAYFAYSVIETLHGEL
ncbi:MAG TPA: DUF1206 domain-containing protein [Acidimicrobiales bacterium]|nr:DUF1206 domain-containing protein [Acidimicrobiales bacterium]